MFTARDFGSNKNSQYGNNNYDNFTKSSWRSGGFDDSPPGRGNRGGDSGMRSGGRDYGSSPRGRGSSRGSGSSWGRGGSSGYGRGGSSNSSMMGGNSGGFNRGSGSGPSRGYTTGSDDWGAASGSSGDNQPMSLLSAAQQMGLTGDWSNSSGLGSGNMGMGSNDNDWNMRDNDMSGKFKNNNNSGGWQTSNNNSSGGWQTSNRGYNTQSSGGRDMSSGMNDANSGRWEMGSSRYSGMSRERDSRQSDDWESRSPRGRGSSRGRDSSRGYDSRGRDRDLSDDRDSGRHGGWKSGFSRGRGSSGSRGRDLSSNRDTGQSRGYGSRGSGYSEDTNMDSGVGNRMGSFMGSDRGSGMSGQSFEQEPREDTSITEKAMDILKAVLGPKGYNAENIAQEYPPNKRRRMDYGGEQEDYQQGPQTHSNRGMGESRWGPSTFNERFSNENDGNRWGQQPKHQNKEENRWGSSRNARHSEDRDEGKWGSKSHGGEQYSRGFSNQEKWGEPQSRNTNFEREGSGWHGDRNQSQWGSQAHKERQGREQNSSRWGPQIQNEYRGENQEQNWEPSDSFNDMYDDNDQQQWEGSRSFDGPEKRRKPLLGPYPEFEKPKPKSLLGPYPGPDKSQPKPKPLLGPYPGHDKPKPKPLLGSFPGSDRPKPKSLLGPYPGHGQDDDDYQWEPTSSRGAMRGRGGRMSRGGSTLGRGRGMRNRRQMNYDEEGMGYGNYQGEMFSQDQSLEYQESGWYEDSEWGMCEQYEGGEEFWPQNYDESQSWQFDDFAWQYGDEQAHQYMHQGSYQPARLSVRDRLGAKKPALLGAAPSVDLVKQLLTQDERKRLSQKYGSLPLEALYCHMCNQSKFSSVDSYLMHQIGRKHVAMTRSFFAKSNATYHLLKTDVKLELKRDRSVINLPTEGYCTTCDTPKWGNAHHKGICANRLLHRFVKPLCCNNRRFASRLQYENHRLSLKHLENDYMKMVASEERFKKRLSELKEEMKGEGLEEELKQMEEEEEKIEKLFTVAERIKAIWALLVPKMNSVGKEKLPDKIVKLKTLREINLRMKKPIKNTYQLVPFDPTEPVGIGNMIISTHYRCSICSKSIDPDKESVIAHCSSEDHYNNALRKQEELRNAEKLALQKKEEEEEEGDDKEHKEDEEEENHEDIGDDEPMEDPYEGESGDINTLMNEVEEMIDNEDEDSREADDDDVPEGFVDNDELIYDDGDIAEEFREVLDYNPDEVEDDGSYEDAEMEGKSTGRSARGRKSKVSPKKENPAAKAPLAARRTRKK